MTDDGCRDTHRLDPGDRILLAAVAAFCCVLALRLASSTAASTLLALVAALLAWISVRARIPRWLLRLANLLPWLPF